MEILVRDQFSVVFGESRGSGIYNESPLCPDGQHKRLLAVNMRPEKGDWWSVGWEGSNLTMTIFLDRDSQSLWQRHNRFIGKTPQPLICQTPYPDYVLDWHEIPDDVQTRIIHEVQQGVHPLCGGTNERPLSIY